MSPNATTLTNPGFVDIEQKARAALRTQIGPGQSCGRGPGGEVPGSFSPSFLWEGFKHLFELVYLYLSYY